MRLPLVYLVLQIELLCNNIHDLRADALLGLAGGRADVRRAGHHRVRLERVVLARLGGKYVKARRANLAGFEPR